MRADYRGVVDVLLGLICCWLAMNVLAGAFLVLRHRADLERVRRSVPRGRRIQTTPGPEIRAERLYPDVAGH